MTNKNFFREKTFGDLLVRPRLGILDTRNQSKNHKISLKMPLTEKIELELPILSANMDTITGSSMAIAMAFEGGVGVIHRGMSIEKQATEVRKVKSERTNQIQNPIRLPATATMLQVKQLMREKGITGILVEEALGSAVLAGILSNRDMPPDLTSQVQSEPVSKYMTPFDRLTLGHTGMTTSEAQDLMFQHRIEKLPIVDSDGKILGLMTMCDINFLRTHPRATLDGLGRLRVGAAIGAKGDYLERASELEKVGVDFLVVDIAHGHSTVMERAVKELMLKVNCEIISGNIATSNGANFLKLLGVSGVKVGIGPGLGCLTRIEAGVGVPQLQAINEACLSSDLPIIADGGVRNDGDIFMAIMAGANSVMLGSMLAGTDEAPGYIRINPETKRQEKLYRGMTSFEARRSRFDDSEELEETVEAPPEGKESVVPYVGSVANILARIRGHLASSLSYCGFETLREARVFALSNPEEFFNELSEASKVESFIR